MHEPGADWIEAAATRENKLLGIDDGWLNDAYLVQPLPKERISIRLDRDVLEFFRSQGRGYQSRINRVLQAFVEQSKRK